VLLAAIAVVALHCNVATAQAYLVRFDEVGYEDVPGDIEKPDERLFTSFPFLTLLDAPFTMRGVRSDGNLTITGVLRRLPDELYQIEDLRYSVVGPDGQMRLETTVSMRLNERLELGGATRRTGAARKSDERHSKRMITVTVRREPKFPQDRRPVRDHDALKVLDLVHRSPLSRHVLARQ
jgi:hypothetical protein